MIYLNKAQNILYLPLNRWNLPPQYTHKCLCCKFKIFTNFVKLFAVVLVTWIASHDVKQPRTHTHTHVRFVATKFNLFAFNIFQALKRHYRCRLCTYSADNTKFFATQNAWKVCRSTARSLALTGNRAPTSYSRDVALFTSTAYLHNALRHTHMHSPHSAPPCDTFERLLHIIDHVSCALLQQPTSSARSFVGCLFSFVFLLSCFVQILAYFVCCTRGVEGGVTEINKSKPAASGGRQLPADTQYQ